MKLRWKIALGGLCLLLLLAGVRALFLGDSERKRAEKTRTRLQAEGFKMQLADFAVSVTPEEHARATSLKNAAAILPMSRVPLIHTGGTNGVALAVWQEAAFEDTPIGQSFSQANDLLDEARDAVMNGTFRLDAPATPGPLRPNTGARDVFRVAQALAYRIELALRDNQRPLAWRDLLALTRLGKNWHLQASPSDYRIRLMVLQTAEEAAWAAVQAQTWNDEQLTQLQSDWQQLELWNELPDTAAIMRVYWLARLQADRVVPRLPRRSPRELFADALSSPSGLWGTLSGSVYGTHYWKHGTFADEEAVTLYFCEEETRLRSAIGCKTWLEMSALPGVENPAPFKSPVNYSPVQVAFTAPRGQLRKSLASRAAEIEALRRVVVTALALERYKLKHGALPSRLEDLVPDYLERLPVDFMDGQPLRFVRCNDSLYSLYSVGLNCVDDHGVMGESSDSLRGSDNTPDLVWPRKARPEEAAIIEARARARASPSESEAFNPSSRNATAHNTSPSERMTRRAGSASGRSNQ